MIDAGEEIEYMFKNDPGGIRNRRSMFGFFYVSAEEVPEVIEEEVRRQRQVERVGRAEGLSARFYAISVERRLTHPAVAVIARAAHADIFTQAG